MPTGRECLRTTARDTHRHPVAVHLDPLCADQTEDLNLDRNIGPSRGAHGSLRRWAIRGDDDTVRVYIDLPAWTLAMKVGGAGNNSREPSALGQGPAGQWSPAAPQGTDQRFRLGRWLYRSIHAGEDFARVPGEDERLRQRRRASTKEDEQEDGRGSAQRTRFQFKSQASRRSTNPVTRPCASR